MSRPVWQVNIIKKLFNKIFLFARITWIPVIGKLIERWLFYKDDVIFIPINTTVTQQDNIVLPSEIVRHFIKQAGFLWIMNECLCRSAEQCKSYPVELGCVFLGDAAKDINPALGRPATVEDALKHIEKCESAGLIHIIGRNRIDTVWLNIGPSHKLMTICNCCECCCLWRILPFMNTSISNNIKKLEGVQVRVTERCIGCGTCAGICFVKAISIIDKMAVVSDFCRGCGRCVRGCPQNALEMSITRPDYFSENINRLSGIVDI